MSKPKNRTGIVYSTNPDFTFSDALSEEVQDLPLSKQKLRISLDKSGRGGKVVTLVDKFVGSFQSLENLGKDLKNHCGTGGSAKDGQILIQGDQRKKVTDYLQKKGASVQQIG
jgi:translation initiation factor 1